MKRADILLVERGLARSRSQARAWIAAGRVSGREGNDWRVVGKPGLRLAPDVELRVERDPADRYVSRGGIKLAAALQRAQLNVADRVAIDVGASTGGFTDCLLQAGATRVVCVDVGHGQLAPGLRDDPRVCSYEGINARELPGSLLQHAPGGFDLAVMDVSFISQTLILPALVPLLCRGGLLISLVKPQFELDPRALGKGGLVREEARYRDVETRIRKACEVQEVDVLAYFDSPIVGGDGNREFLMVGERRDGPDSTAVAGS